MSFKLSDIQIFAPIDGVVFSDEFPNVKVTIYSDNGDNIGHKLHLFIDDVENKTISEITKVSERKLKQRIKDYL